MGIVSFLKGLFRRRVDKPVEQQPEAVAVVGQRFIELHVNGKDFRVPLLNSTVEGWADLFAAGQLMLHLHAESAVAQAIAPQLSRLDNPISGAIVTPATSIVVKRTVGPAVARPVNVHTPEGRAMHKELTVPQSGPQALGLGAGLPSAPRHLAPCISGRADRAVAPPEDLAQLDRVLSNEM